MNQFRRIRDHFRYFCLINNLLERLQMFNKINLVSRIPGMRKFRDLYPFYLAHNLLNTCKLLQVLLFFNVSSLPFNAVAAGEKTPNETRRKFCLNPV